MSDLVGHPEDRFSQNEAQLVFCDISVLNYMYYGFMNNIVNFYRNDPKFSDRSVWANSADQDQTAPRGAV